MNQNLNQIQLEKKEMETGKGLLPSSSSTSTVVLWLSQKFVNWGLCNLPSLTMGNLESSKLRAKNSDFCRYELPWSDPSINSGSSNLTIEIWLLLSKVAKKNIA